MNEEFARMVCAVPTDLHPLSQSALEVLLRGDFTSKAEFFRYFALVNSDYLIVAECLWAFINSSVGV